MQFAVGAIYSVLSEGFNLMAGFVNLNVRY